MVRYVLSGIREEDLIILLYFLLASAHLSGHEVEAYGPEITARRCLIVNGRYKEIIEFLVKSPKSICFVKLFLLLLKQGKHLLTYPSKLNFVTLLASSSAVVHVGPAQGFTSSLVPLQWWVPPEGVVTL